MSTHTPCLDCKPEVKDSPYFHHGTVTKGKPCGCELYGSGTLPDPWHIHFCPLHAQAPAMREALERGMAIVEHFATASNYHQRLEKWLDETISILAQIEKG